MSNGIESGGSEPPDTRRSEDRDKGEKTIHPARKHTRRVEQAPRTPDAGGPRPPGAGGDLEGEREDKIVAAIEANATKISGTIGEESKSIQASIKQLSTDLQKKLNEIKKTMPTHNIANKSFI